MRILVVDNNMHVRGYPQGLMVRAHLGRFAARTYVKKPDELDEGDIDVDRVILSGSMAYVRQNQDWMDTERRYLERWLDRGARVLGVCFGAQLLATHLFGRDSVAPMPVPISGSVLLEQTRQAPLLEGLPTRFGVVTTHYDGCVMPPEYIDAQVDVWSCYVFHHPAGAWGLQFHPELMGPEGRALVRLQRLIYDRHVYQEFDVPTKRMHGMQIYRNFITNIP